MNTLKTIVLVAALLIAALGVRIWRITEAPASVNWDEAAVGYNGYSLLRTGRDEFGKILPVSLRSFDDYKPALYSYLSAVPIKIIGLDETSTRMTSILAGVILVFCVLYLTAKTSGSLKLGLTAGVFTAFSPWAIHFSRIAFEANLAAGIYFAAIGAFVLGIREKRYLTLSATLFVISMYAYHAQRAIAIPTFIGLVLLYRQKIRFGRLILPGVLLMPLVISFFTEPAGSRLTATFILKLWPFVPDGYPQIPFSPVWAMIWQLAGHFLAYFSPATIFVRGSNEPILRIPTLGLLPLELLPLWLAGLANVYKRTVLNKWLWVVLLLAPLPGVITWNWFSAVRTLAMYPAFAVLSAIGGRWIYQKVNTWRMPATVLFAGLFALSAWYTVLTVDVYAPHETYGDFQPGFEKSIPYLLTESRNYNKVIIDSPHIAPYIFLLFYGKYPPRQYLEEAGYHRVNSGTEDCAFGKYEFRRITPEDLSRRGILLMGPTPRIPDYVEDEWVHQGFSVRDFYDPLGYISFRVASL